MASNDEVLLIAETELLFVILLLSPFELDEEDGEDGLRRCSGDPRVSGELLRCLRPFSLPWTGEEDGLGLRSPFPRVGLGLP